MRRPRGFRVPGSEDMLLWVVVGLRDKGVGLVQRGFPSLEEDGAQRLTER